MKKRRKELVTNRIAIIGITIVVLFMAFAISVRSSALREKEYNYRMKEERLAAEIEEQLRKSKELEEMKVYITTKEYTIKKARDIFGLKMPDEIVIKPAK